MSTEGAVRAYVLAESDRADTEHTARLGYWRDGYRACQASHPGQYQQGFADGILFTKRTEHAIHRELKALYTDLAAILEALRAGAA